MVAGFPAAGLVGVVLAGLGLAAFSSVAADLVVLEIAAQAPYQRYQCQRALPYRFYLEQDSALACSSVAVQGGICAPFQIAVSRW